MEFNEILATIFQVIIIPLCTVLTGYLVKWINAKANDIKTTVNDERIQKYITMLDKTITSAVVAVNQTYVDSLKQQGAFDKEAQITAFNKVYEAVMLSLTEEANFYLEEIIGDLNAYITNKIEEEVNIHKLSVKTN